MDGAGALVLWLWKEIHVTKVVSSNSGTVYWMDIFHIPICAKFVMCVWKDENKWKRGQGWSIFIQVNGLNSSNQDTRMNTHCYFLALAPSTSPHLSTTFFFVVLSRSAPLLPRHRIREQTIAKVKNNFRSTSTFNPIFFSDKKKQNIFPRAGWLDERWQYKNK